MLNRIIGFSVHNKLIIAIATLFLLVFGAYQLTKLPIDAVPDITNNQVQVITVSPSLGAPDIERLITFPIEQALSNIPGKIEIRSFSRFGLSLVTIVFNDETDVYWARQQVSERLQSITEQIPAGVGVPELGPVTTGLGEIYQYVLRAKPGYEGKYDAQSLRTIQDWIVRRQLLGVKGVADVSSFGGLLKQYQVAVDPQRLQAHGVSMSDVFTALEKNNQNEGGAYIEKGPQVLFIRSEGLLQNISSIEQIVVKSLANGAPLFIRDIGKVEESHATRYGAMVYNDKDEVAGAVVMMLKGANSNEVIKAVKERITQIESTLPEGVMIDAFLDRTKMVNNAIGTVETNLLEGALIVIFILVLFLGNMRAGLLVASVIPLSMLFAVSMMNLFGVSGNLMSLGALDFGLIIDGAVIIVEAVMHNVTHSKRLHMGLSEPKNNMDLEVKNAAGKMMNSAVFGQLIILIVYLPILSLSGIEGKMFKPMAQTVAFALIGAFILSLTYVPMMSALLLKNLSAEPNFAEKWMDKLALTYSRLLAKLMQYPARVLAGVIGLFILSIWVLSTLGGEFIPSLEEGDFAVETRVLTGSNLNVSIATAKQSAKVLLEEFPEVEKVVSKIGSGEIPTDPMPMEAQDLMIILKDKSEWTSAKGFPELAEKMSEALSVIPGVTYGFQYPVQMRFNELMTGARQDVVCKIFGENLDSLAYYGKRMGDLAQQIDGAKDVFVEPIGGMPQIVVNYNRDKLAQYQLSVAAINEVMYTAFAGKKAGMVYEGERRFDLLVRMQNNQRTNLEDVRNLLIPTQQNTCIPLHQLAEVNIVDGPNQIQREDAKRRIVMGFNVRGRDVQSIVADLKEKMKNEVKLPTGYYVSYGGSFENLEAAKSRLSIAVPISLLLIFILLYFAFHSVKQGLLIYSAIPLSAMGGVFALALRGMPFSISAGIGFIALFGVAVLNGIVLIAEFNRQRELGVMRLTEVVIAGAKLRLRPVLMTAAVASLGFLPMALSNGAGAEVQRPLATVVIGGLLLATLLTLFVLPILYVLFEKKSTLNKGVQYATLFVALFIWGSTAEAQQRISLSAAIDSALNNNPGLTAASYKTMAAQKMQGSAWNLPNAEVLYANGQTQSFYQDNSWEFSQRMAFPGVYTAQKKVLQADYDLAKQDFRLASFSVKAELSEVYYQYLHVVEKEKIFEKIEKQLAELLKLADLRLAAGESNIIEKSATAQQMAETIKQLQHIKLAKQVSLAQFQILLGTAQIYVPDEGSIRIALSEELAVENNPHLIKFETQQRVSAAKLQTERMRFMPELLVAYQNMSITGVGNDDRFYPKSARFQSVQLGVGMPLFFGSNLARTKALQLELKASEMQVMYARKQWMQQRDNLRKQIFALDTICRYYENGVLIEAAKAQDAAWQQYQQGGINFMEWMMLYNQAIQTNIAYLDVVQQLNQYIIQYQNFQSIIK